MAKLSYNMGGYIDQISADWGPMPPSTGCTSSTLKGLMARGLVERRGINPCGGFYSDFQVRLTPPGVAVKAERDARFGRLHPLIRGSDHG